MTALGPQRRERRLLQVAIAVAALVPIAAGLAGALAGFDVFAGGAAVGRDLDSHGRYLSGLLLAIGLGFWSIVPRIETQGPRARLLAALVVVGGLARLAGLVLVGVPSAGMLGALVMELVVTPALALWQLRIAGFAEPAQG